jgi:hypothetical protein
VLRGLGDGLSERLFWRPSLFVGRSGRAAVASRPSFLEFRLSAIGTRGVMERLTAASKMAPAGRWARQVKGRVQEGWKIDPDRASEAHGDQIAMRLPCASDPMGASSLRRTPT